MREFKNCQNCKHIFQVTEHNKRTCDNCLASYAESFKDIENLLEEEPLLSAFDIAQKLNMPINKVMCFVEEFKLVPEGHTLLVVGEALQRRTERAEQLPEKLERSGLKGVRVPNARPGQKNIIF